MSKFRKKPVVIEACRLPSTSVDGSTNEDHENYVWAFLSWCRRVGFEPVNGEAEGSVTIETLEGALTASPGDWIIQGVKGEFYPCKPDIFAATYDSEETERGDQAIEKEIQAKGLTAPRVTPADLEANIADVEIVKHVSKSGQVLRWAVLTTKSGFAVAGKPSCAASSENDNAEIGEKIAVSNSKEEMWPLMGYELKCRLHAEGGEA